MECNRNWIILRPTNVWGPLHPFFPYELWKYLKLRLYSHPGCKPVIKYYSYIENAIDQIMAIAFGHDDLVCGKVFYITDPPIDNADWMNAFSVSLSGRSVRKMPLAMWKIFAKCGDVLSGFGLRFPMSSERLFRLTVNEQIPIQPTMQISGNPRISMEDGVKRSVQWYESMQKGEF